MAYVKMGQIKVTLAKALAYISRPDATADGLWVSTNAAVIDPSDYKAVAEQFARTAESVGVSHSRIGVTVGGRRAREEVPSTGDRPARPAVSAKPGSAVLAHHVIQSFDPDEKVTPEVAHRLGVQLAEKVTGGQHEYMIATHLDKGHVHNHIIFNSVNFESGRKFRVQRDTIGRVRAMSDQLCRAAGLRVMPTHLGKSAGRSLADIYRVMKGESGKEFLRTEIDKAASRAQSWTEFEEVLGRAGIETSARGGLNGTVSYREMSMSRPVRDYRLGASYTEQSIMARMSKRVVNMVGVDSSMIVKETIDTLTVVVPGSKRTLHMTVAKKQVVRHGRALRIYVPSSEKHRLADPKGNLARTVDTAGLYKYFAEPDLTAALSGAKLKQSDTSMVTGWGSMLSDLRALQDRVNAKSRWLDGGVVDADTALARATEHFRTQHFEYQSTLVAAAESMADPSGDAGDLMVLQARLRIIERDLSVVMGDVRALTHLSSEEVKAVISERIGSTVRAVSVEKPQREISDPLATDPESPKQRPSLQERINAQVAQLKRREQRPGSDDTNRGKHR